MSYTPPLTDASSNVDESLMRDLLIHVLYVQVFLLPSEAGVKLKYPSSLRLNRKDPLMVFG